MIGSPFGGADELAQVLAAERRHCWCPSKRVGSAVRMRGLRSAWRPPRAQGLRSRALSALLCSSSEGLAARVVCCFFLSWDVQALLLNHVDGHYFYVTSAFSE